ncbi:MAG: hypothetical protein MI749_18390, partial [Desulfovibrionales bacterium]|nr:hypothetical protein [Desulfovibrionales bacterium]
LIMVLFGCSWNHGDLKHNPVWLSQSHSKTLPTQLNYYYCGRSSIPYAVVGIDKEWNFDSKFWVKAKDMDHVYYLIGNLSDLHTHSGKKIASDILDTRGNRIGIWFSYYNYSPVEVDAKNKRVGIVNPYNPSDGDGSHEKTYP